MNGNQCNVSKVCMCDTHSGCCGATTKRTIVGGWAFAWWFVTDVQRISLEVMTVNPVCEHVETSQGVPLTVTGVAQIKIMRADDLLKTAAEQFLGVPVNQLRSTVNQTLEGHLRAILGLYYLDIQRGWQQKKVQERKELSE
ncbi:Flotillin-2 [Orchesella cincta]|uniref:Flotillin-2 n=1 Tax=Orchesella cincta TaxID=48709 RepID=A0A1D2MH32_ORCCI|nr:Flotillin-2 [Orchesella cincta]